MCKTGKLTRVQGITRVFQNNLSLEFEFICEYASGLMNVFMRINGGCFFFLLCGIFLTEVCVMIEAWTNKPKLPHGGARPYNSTQDTCPGKYLHNWIFL